jgi:hypothetical protein
MRRELNTRKIAAGWFLAALSVGSCASTSSDESVNNYVKFYTAESGATPDAIAATRVASPTGSPRVVPVASWDSSIASVYARQGYALIGSTSFTSGRPESDQDAINLGVQLGADLIVILNPQYKETVTANVPISSPTATTSNTSTSATAYGSGGPVTAYGNSTTTTYGTSTTYTPITAQRSAYGAGYFIKRRYRFGAIVRDLNDSERQQLQTNRGVYITTVIDHTPAYNADILVSDVILGINGQPLNGQAGFTDPVNANRGQTVELTIIRSGKTLSKQISILD